jgi:hypothetical protein
VYEAAKDADGNRKRVTYDSGGSVQFQLSAGRYYVTASFDKATGGSEVSILAGQELQLQLQLRPTK